MMNETGEFYKAQLISRLEDAGIYEGIDYSLTCAMDPDPILDARSTWKDQLGSNNLDPRYFFRTQVLKRSKDIGRQEWHKITYAIMGVIHHMKNRKWICYHGYTYIMPDMHSFEFQHDKTKTD